jgi:membrane protein
MENTSMSGDIVQEVGSQISKVTKVFNWIVAESKWYARVIISSCDRFYWDNGFSKAASLAYSTLLSMVPVMALAFSILGSFVASSESGIRDFISRILRQFTPSTHVADTVVEYLTNFSQIISSLNELAAVFLVITSILLLNSIEYALNEIWQVFELRTIPHRIARFCAIILIAPVLAISGYYTTSHFRLEPLLHDMGYTGTFDSLYNTLFPFLVDYVAFFLLYYLVPKAPVKFSSATFGAFLAAILFGLAKQAFAFYVVQFSSYAAIYGTLAAVPIFLIWLYLAWIIVLLGAESCYQAQYLPRTGKLWKRSVLSLGDGKMLLAMQALVIIARSFQDGSKMPGDLEIAEKLGCSSVVLKPALDLLEGAKILVRGDNREMPLTLLRSPDKITLTQIKTALYKSDKSMHFTKEMRKVFECFRSEKDSKDATLADILAESI